jgi:mono/diheme cytochrome c family protein
VRRAIAPLVLLAALGGCDLSMSHQQRHKTFDSATLWDGGPPASPPPDGTVPRDALGRQAALDNPPHMTLALLERGRDRYGIHCAMCHGSTGAADGPVVQRGFPAPPSYGSDKVRALSARQVVGIIGHGYGIMYPRNEVAPRDRWAIAGYVKALGQAMAEAEAPPGVKP